MKLQILIDIQITEAASSQTDDAATCKLLFDELSEVLQNFEVDDIQVFEGAYTVSMKTLIEEHLH